MAEKRDQLVFKTSLIEREFELYFNTILGLGDSGDVRCCREISTGKEFALKILLDDAESRQEARIHQQLSGHPHIVTLHSVYRNSIKLEEDAAPRARLLLVIELMVGGSMIDWWDERKTDETTVIVYMKQMVDAVKHVHGLGIAHRDIKPANFLFSDFTENVVVKLADFGFAREDRGDLNSPYFSRYYVAPEVLQVTDINDKRKHKEKEFYYDKSCDMWSLGVTMYYMLCNYFPFSEYEYEENDNALYKSILNGDYEFPSREWDVISQEAKDIVKRLLHVDPRQRMTVQELADHPWLRGIQRVECRGVFPCSPIIVSDEEIETEFPESRITVVRTWNLANNTWNLANSNALFPGFPMIETDEESETEVPRQGLTVTNSTVSSCCPVKKTWEQSETEVPRQGLTVTNSTVSSCCPVKKTWEQSETEVPRQGLTVTNSTVSSCCPVKGTWEQSETEVPRQGLTVTNSTVSSCCPVKKTWEQSETEVPRQGLTVTNSTVSSCCPVKKTWEQSETEVPRQGLTVTNSTVSSCCPVKKTWEQSETEVPRQALTVTNSTAFSCCPVKGTWEQSETVIPRQEMAESTTCIAAYSSAFLSSVVTESDEESDMKVQPSSKARCNSTMIYVKLNELHHLNTTGVSVQPMGEADNLQLCQRKQRHNCSCEDSEGNATPLEKKRKRSTRL